MPQSYDGDIRLSVSINAKDAKQTAQELSAQISKIFDGASGKSTDVKFQSIQRSMAKSVDSANRLIRKMHELESVQTPTAEYSELQKLLDEDTRKLAKVTQKIVEMQEAGKSTRSTAFHKLSAEADELRDSIENARNEMQQLRDSGGAFTLGSGSDQYQKYVEQLNDVNNQMTLYIAKAQEASSIEEGINPIPNAEEKISGLSKVQSLIVGIGQSALNALPAIQQTSKNLLRMAGTGIIAGLRKVRSAISELGKHSKTTEFSFKRLFRTVLKYGLGIRSLFMLFRRLRSYAVEALKAMAQQFPEVNSQLSSLTSAFAQFKNSIGSAVYPLINALAPALTMIINLATQAMNAVANFIAVLTGQKFIYKATKQNKDFAGSVAGAGAAAKEANKQLAEFDKLEVLNADKDSGAGGGGGAGVDPGAFEKALAASSPLAEKLKKILGDIWDVFKQAWANKGEKVMESFHKMIDSLKRMLLAIGRTWLEVWTDGTGLRYLESVLELVRMIFDLISAVADAFTDAWERNRNGYNLVKSVFDMLTAINLLLVDVGDSFERAFRTEVGISIFENIFQIITNINETVAELATRWREAWNTDGLGDSIAQNILGILDSILTTINDITASTRAWAEEIDFTPLLEATNGFLEDCKDALDRIGGIISDIYEKYILPLSTWFTEQAAPVVLDLIGEALDFIAKVAEEAYEDLKLIWDNIFQPIVSTIGDAVLEFFQALADDLEELGNNKQVVEVLGAIVAVIITAVGVLASLSAIITVVTGVMALFTNPVFLIIAAITALIVIIVQCINHWDLIKAKVQEVADAIRDKVVQIFTAVKDFIGETIQAIKDKITEISTAIRDFIFEIFGAIRDKIDEILNAIWETVEEVWDSIWSTITDFANSIHDTVVDVFESMSDALRGIWDGIVDFIRTCINGIIGAVEGMANGVVNGVNAVIDVLNGLSFTIPDWVPGWGGRSFGFSLPHLSGVSIPRLAQGAVIPPNKEFLALLGDQSNGTNIEAPLDTIVDAVSIAQEDLVRILLQQNDILRQMASKEFTISSRNIFNAVGKESDDYIKQTGKSRFAY